MRNVSSIVEFWTGGARPSLEGFRRIAARSILAGRIATRESFPAGLVNDPVSEIMMSVFIAGATQGAMPFDAACAAGGVGMPTGARWIAALEQEGLIDVTTGAGGKRVALSAKGLATVTRTIDAVLARQTDILG